MTSIHDPKHSAVLLWFPEGETPVAADFDQDANRVNAEKWYFVHQAIDQVYVAIANQFIEGRNPWVLHDGKIMNRNDILTDYFSRHPQT